MSGRGADLAGSEPSYAVDGRAVEWVHFADRRALISSDRGLAIFNIDVSR